MLAERVVQGLAVQFSSIVVDEETLCLAIFIQCWSYLFNVNSVILVEILAEDNHGRSIGGGSLMFSYMEDKPFIVFSITISKFGNLRIQDYTSSLFLIRVCAAKYAQQLVIPLSASTDGPSVLTTFNRALISFTLRLSK